MQDVFSIPGLIVLAAAAIGAWTDWRKYRVYNWLTLPLAISGLAYHGLMSSGIGLGASLLGLLLGFALLILPYALGLMGAGDVKLLAGIGAWIGWQNVLLVFVGTVLVAGVYAWVVTILRGEWKETWAMFQLIYYRFVTLGSHLGRDDLVETTTSAKQRRLRAIPFAAAVPFGLLAAAWWMKTH